MYAPYHSLAVNDPQTLRRARRWLLLGVVALGVAGIFAGLLGRPTDKFFSTALAEHVDLSVLIWFFTQECMLFTLAADRHGWGMLKDASFLSFALGTVLVVLAAFTGAPAYKSDYIPVLYHPMFFLGLGLIFCGVLGSALGLLACGRKLLSATPQVYGIVIGAWIMLVAMACFFRSILSLKGGLQGEIYYEYAFWGGGHVLQFVHTQLLLVCWAWLAGAAGIRIRLKPWQMAGLYFVGLIVAFMASNIYVAYPVTSNEFRGAFTMLMSRYNGLAPVIMGLVIVISIVFPFRDMAAEYNAPQHSPKVPRPGRLMTVPGICLIMSMLLFIVGGGLGYLIKGSNVIVPAHYHGSIIGITLAFMGVAYLLLPAFGWADVSRSKFAFWQPVVYGSGQLCWMLAMAILGEHGVPRKTAGSADTQGMFISFLKHSADGLALIGGLLFVFVVLHAVWVSRKAKLCIYPIPPKHLWHTMHTGKEKRLLMEAGFSPQELVLYNAIHKILLEEWDPIGVRQLGAPDDEYDSYLPNVFSLAIKRVPPIEIAEYLYFISSQFMGLQSSVDINMFVADKIWKLAQENH